MPLPHARTGLVALLVLASCGRTSSTDTTWTGTIRDSAGVTLVSNPVEGVWSASSRWHVTEDLRIGSIDDPDYQFGEIGGIGVGDAGVIVVFDHQADRPVRIFDAQGVLVRQAGGWGAGPGEFGGGAGPVLVAGDSLLVIPDGGNGRVNLFDMSGGFLRSITVTLNEMTNKWGVTSGGIPVAQLGMSAMPGMEETDDLVDVLVAIGPDGTDRDTLLVFPSGRQMYFEGGSPELTFFAPEPWWLIGPGDDVWMGINDHYAIGVYRDGELVRHVRRDFEPIAVSERDREVVLDAWIRVFEQRMPNAEALLGQLAQFHEQFPAFQQFMVNDDGTLWVQRLLVPSTLTEQEAVTVDPTTGWGSPTWDVFDAEGRYLGKVEFPRRFSLQTLRGTSAYGVWRDDLDVEYAMRLRIASRE